MNPTLHAADIRRPRDLVLAVEDRPVGRLGRLVRHGLTAAGRSWAAGNRVLVAIPVALITAITLASVFAPMGRYLVPLLVAAPASTATFASARFTAVIALCSSAAMLVVDVHDRPLNPLMPPIQVIALLLASGFFIAVRVLHDRNLSELTQVRAVSEAAQRVLLRPLPHRIGSLRVASVYRTAAAHALVGGDLYAAARTSGATRFLIGDARGKGLPAIDDASALLGAFREAAHRNATLPDLAATLESSVRRHLAHIAETDLEGNERFTTALIVEIPDAADIVRMVSCGHPAPLLEQQGAVRALRAHRPAPPLGLGSLAPGAYHVDSAPFHVGDTLLLYTDGIIEARNASGAFYPVSDRVATCVCPWIWHRPHRLLRHILHDVQTYVGGRLDDDLAMVAIQRTSSPAITKERKSSPPQSGLEAAQ
ncbi:PP2C family protein-serine/threonine phosphatase [Streptomyces sp. NPDC001978]|uniref:PP2C family protein-serine/threonine phosphatase n=1 Tax=Streptomyces sp. NPDC001978 TaxID=3364627 RepID=UPI00369620D4